MERLRRLIIAHRRSVAAISAGLAVLTVTVALTADPPAGTAVAVAATDLPSGHVVTRGDVRIVHVPAGAAAAGRLTGATAVGRVVGGPMRRGEAFTDQRVLQARRLGAGDRVLATVPVDSSAVTLLRVGDRVDVLSVVDDDAAATTIARSAPVVVVKTSSRSGSGTATVGLATSAKDATTIARAALAGQLTVVSAVS